MFDLSCSTWLFYFFFLINSGTATYIPPIQGHGLMAMTCPCPKWWTIWIFSNPKPCGTNCHVAPWWRHQMETFSALLAICAGNSPVTGEFPAQRPVKQSFDVFFDLRLNKWLIKQSWDWWFETPSRPLWRHCNALHPKQGHIPTQIQGTQSYKTRISFLSLSPFLWRDCAHSLLAKFYMCASIILTGTWIRISSFDLFLAWLCHINLRSMSQSIPLLYDMHVCGFYLILYGIARCHVITL